jgi:hypothetical protein
VNTEQLKTSRTIERRKKPRKIWAIKRDRGAILEWKVDPRQTKAQESDDPLARTYNFLQKLSVPGMALEDETPLRRDGRNPYDNARAYKGKKPVSRK